MLGILVAGIYIYILWQFETVYLEEYLPLGNWSGTKIGSLVTRIRRNHDKNPLLVTGTSKTITQPR